MPAPRIFVSSTYFDLKQVRSDLSRFVSDLGFEPVMFEAAVIPYEASISPAEASIQEVERCDFLVSIVGSRAGSVAPGQDHSVSVAEFKRALESNKQIFIFIMKDVLTEYKTYMLNKEVKDFKYWSVDNIKIFQFIEEIISLPKNNAHFAFERTEDIVNILRKQFAGLFFDMIQRQSRIEAASIVSDLKFLTQSLQEIVKKYGTDHQAASSVVNEIIISNHPLIKKLRDITHTPYRLIISNFDEMKDWLVARSFRLIHDKNRLEFIDMFSSEIDPVKDYFVFEKIAAFRRRPATTEIIAIARDNFDRDGNLKPAVESSWRQASVIFERLGVSEKTTSEGKENSLDDDIPF
jgi:hypothetical protein